MKVFENWMQVAVEQAKCSSFILGRFGFAPLDDPALLKARADLDFAMKFRPCSCCDGAGVLKCDCAETNTDGWCGSWDTCSVCNGTGLAKPEGT